MSSTNPDRSSEEIRRDIERTRAHMDETVEELRDRLSPGQLVDEVWSRFRRSGRGVGDIARDHAVPLALMGLGVAWLAVEEATGHSRHDHVRRHGADPHRPSFGRDDHDEGGHRLRDKASDAASSLKGAARSVGDAAHSARESARDAKHWVGDKLDRAGEAGGDARDAAHRAAGAVRHAGEETRDRFRSAKYRASELMEESPLTVGAITFGIGLASGLAIPTSRVEDRLMGERSEELKHEARERAHELKEEAEHVAADAVEGARSGIESHTEHRPSTEPRMGDGQDDLSRGAGEPRL